MKKFEYTRQTTNATRYRTVVEDAALSELIASVFAETIGVDLDGDGVRYACHITKDAGGIGPITTRAEIEIVVDHARAAGGGDLESGEMKYAQEVMDMLAANPQRWFPMREMVNYVQTRVVVSNRNVAREGIRRVLASLHQCGALSMRKPRVRGAGATYRWRCDARMEKNTTLRGSK
ncbi:hypothetical protein [Paraburkholderia sacchari]|uniref:hypothetical protein n=1 Tax=Paraburkholderia sacchari TaxID=159450 RepID=UPI001BD0C65B|nr:hypothetical protein [Paraburkholderia sacchari]